MPVLWTGERHLSLPPCAAGLQYTDGRLGDSYGKLGIYGLMIEDMATFQTVTFRIATRIVDVATATQLKPVVPSLFDDAVNAFEVGE